MIEIIKWSQAGNMRKDQIMKRSALDISKVLPQVKEWIDSIRKDGDKAIIEYIRKFDDPEFFRGFRITQNEIKNAYKKISPDVLDAIKKQVELSRSYQENLGSNSQVQLQEAIPGVLTGKRITPIDSVGLYIPAGSAPLPTVMQVLGVAAKQAGVKRIVACFPPKGNLPEMLVAADLSGIDELYCIGGIAAIAAMAYGTQSIDPVLKIAGPGNIYVQAAKSLVRDDVAIDMIAGPSEGLLIADERADPKYLAIDLLAKAEHDPNSSGILVTWDQELAIKTKKEVERLYSQLKRKDIIKEALKRYFAIIIVNDLEEAISLSNEYSPEHIEILVENPIEILPRITNAGSIFLGDYAPIAVGDYASGTNHVLPTGIWPKTSSPISVRTFQKESEVQYLTKEGLEGLRPIVQKISDVEGLDAHKLSVDIRLS
ncbi:histidinol dehydrogenase [Patescibacteria group bacterium]|nr:histidinol dehydrogenase [Patescibacteria group bacterium]